MKKILFLTFFAAYSAFGCWYQKSNYTDYIYSINDQVTITTQIVDNISHYTIQNNKVVDFPLTISMKLISDEVIDIGDGKTSEVGNITGKLQYRVLPGGNWVTVSEYTVPSGKISKDSKPSTYFGKNNIWPKNCKAGDVIMIRLYITDGMWQSGTLKNKCDLKLQNISTSYGTRLTLPNTISYTITAESLKSADLGGTWAPHLVSTVIYSGKSRPLR